MAIKIYIDQGHNYSNPNAGAEGNGFREQDITYDIGTRLASLLRADPEFEVRTSRTSPTQILGNTVSQSLAARVQDANTWGADYFISLHTNASTVESASGTEAFVYNLSSPATGLAEEIVEGITEATGLRDRGVASRPGLYVLKRTAMPATLIEMGFISNADDAALMIRNPELFAEGIYNGIMDYFD